MITKSRLHFIIIDRILENGHAPNLNELSDLLDAPEKDVEQALYDLQDYHGVVLHPDQPKIWVIHPFSLAPTNFIVRTKKKKWWGSCAWCSLGIAALLKEDVTITTSFGTEGEKIVIHIKDGKILENDLMVHFPIPMKEAWNNVIYTCSTMLIFKNDEDVAKWSLEHNIPKGDVQNIEKVWEFSQKWYGSHADPDWVKWTVKEAMDIFKQHGLTHKVWELEDSLNRF